MEQQMKNINPIPSSFRESFLKTSIGKKIEKENYDVILIDEPHQFFSTPREDLMTRCFSIAPFYYIDLLTEKSPKTIYDVGCGCNLWKNYYSNIIGVDPVHTNADIQDTFDKNFVAKYNKKIQSMISINALHFIPIGQLVERLKEVNETLADDGRAFITCNLARLIEYTEDLNFLGITNFKKYRPDPKLLKIIENYIRSELYTSTINFVCVDIDFSNYNSFINGNIRLVFDKS
jgi:hypothetical protein